MAWLAFGRCPGLSSVLRMCSMCSRTSHLATSTCQKQHLLLHFVGSCSYQSLLQWPASNTAHHVLHSDCTAAMHCLNSLQLLHSVSVIYSQMYCALTASICRDATSMAAVAVQLDGMQNTASPATCMASCADKHKAVIGSQSGHVLLVSIINQPKSETRPVHSELGSIATATDMFPSHNLSEAVPNSTAALAMTALSEQHSAAVTSAQLSPDSRHLATISAEDGAVFVWDTLPGSMADLYLASKATIAGASCAAWLPGKRLLVGSSSHQLVVSPTLVPALLLCPHCFACAYKDNRQVCGLPSCNLRNGAGLLCCTPSRLPSLHDLQLLSKSFVPRNCSLIRFLRPFCVASLSPTAEGAGADVDTLCQQCDGRPLEPAALMQTAIWPPCLAERVGPCDRL